MKVYTRLEYIWDGQKYVEVYAESYDCPENGFALCKGADASQTDLAKSQTDFYNTLKGDYAKQFGGKSAILNTLTTNLTPVVNAGPTQFGFAPGEVNALNSQAIEGTAQAYRHAQQALQNQQAARGGGNVYLPSGVDAQNAATLASNAANTTSNQLLDIQNRGYEQGNRNYNNAIAALGGTAQTYNPALYMNGATSAGNSAAAETNLVAKENAESNPWGTIGGILGGVAGSFLGPIGTALGSKVGGMIGGAASGGSGGTLFGSPNELGG
jgi:hypothetical protein